MDSALLRDLCAVAVFLLFASAFAYAEPKALVANIPPEPLAQALEDFSHQTDLQVVYLSEVIGDLTTQGASAHLEPTEALTQLLQGSGLRFEFLNSRTVRVLVAPQQPDDVLVEIVVTAKAGGEPWPPRYAPATDHELRTIDTANRDLEQRIARSQLLYRNAQVEQYLQEVAGRLLAIDATDASTVHVHIIKAAEANVFALSNGSVYITTAMIVALRDEAELAGVLGHELTHYTNAHALRGMREERRDRIGQQSVDALLLIALGALAMHNHMTPVSSPAYRPIPPGPTLALWDRASIAGYPRDLECEADYGGVHRAILAGYDPGAALSALHRLAGQAVVQDASARPLYSSRPKLEERISNYRQMLPEGLSQSRAPDDQRRTALYRARLGDLPLDQVTFLLGIGALDRADAALANETVAGDSGRAEFLKGEIARNRIPQTDTTLERALAAYERAMTFPDAPASAYRQAGLLHRMRGESAAAALAFQNYLALAPAAVDAPFVRIYLDQLRAMSPQSEAPL
jgi:Zn-dependent protease with chaperone function